MLYLAYIVVPVIGLYVVRKYREYQWGYYDSNSPLNERVFLVTGCNSGIGKEVVKSLAKRSAHVIMACRDLKSADAAIREIREVTASGVLVPMRLDLASLESVREFAEEVLKTFPEIHVLINNAGVYFPVNADEKTADGFEMNMGINHLGHFLLTNLLVEKLKSSSPSRIVIVSSGLHERGVIDVDDLNMEKRKKELEKVKLNAAYCASKLANVYHSRELAQRLKGSNVNVYALCPGFTYTNLFRHSNIRWWQYIAFLPIAFFYMRSARQGAQTVLYCATDEALTDKSGFYRNCKPYESSVNFDREIQKGLWERSDELTRVDSRARK